MDISALKLIIESILLVNKEPVTIDRLQKLFSEEETVSVDQIKEAIVALQADLATRSFELIEVASGYRLQVKQNYAPYVQVLWEEKPPKYSRAILETLALIAYQQPITRAEIEEVRGVAVSTHIVKTLQDREWIKVVGHRDVPGRPALFATTKAFLDYFNLSSLRDLPDIPEPEAVDLKRADEKIAKQLELALESDLAVDDKGERSETVYVPNIAVNESDVFEEDVSEASLEAEPDDEPVDFSAIEAVLAKAELAMAGRDPDAPDYEEPVSESVEMLAQEQD